MKTNSFILFLMFISSKISNLQQHLIKPIKGMLAMLPFMIILMLVASIIFTLSPSIWTVLPVIVIGVLLISGIINIENRPPQIGILTRFNKKIWANKKAIVLREGYNWILLKGIIYDILLISAERRIRKIDPQDVLTPDNVNIQVPISLEWNIDEENLDTFIEIGEGAGVDNHIKDILEGGLREYSRNPNEGPMSWREMIGSGIKALDFLVKSLSPSEDNPPKDNPIKDTPIKEVYDHLERIDNKIPTPILFDYFSGKKPPNAIIRKEWGDGKEWTDDWSDDFDKNWSKLLYKINQYSLDIDKLEGKIKKREDLLKRVRNGKARIKIANTGAYLMRLTVGDVKPSGEIYLADIELQKEERQRVSETFEVQTDLEKAVILQNKLKELNEETSFADCFNAIMKWKNFKPGTGFFYEGSLSGIAGIGDIIKDIMKGGKS